MSDDYKQWSIKYEAQRVLWNAATAKKWDVVWDAFDAVARGEHVLSFKDICGHLTRDDTLLMVAVKQANVDVINALRRRGVDPNVEVRASQCGSFYRTALNIAVEMNRIDIVRTLLLFDTIDHRVPYCCGDWWPLTICMRPTVDADIAKLIIGLYTEPPASKYWGKHWIRAALKNNVPERIDWMLAKFGLDARYRYIECLPERGEHMDSGPSFDPSCSWIHTSLDVNVEFRKCVRLLPSVKWLHAYAEKTRQRFDIDYGFWEALQAVAPDTVEYFLKLGANISKLYYGAVCGDDNKDYVLQVAFSGFEKEGWRLRDKLNSSRAWSRYWRNSTNFRVRKESLGTQCARIVKLLLQYGADPNAVYTKRYAWYTPLVAAINTKAVEAAMVLLRWYSVKTPPLRLDTVCGVYYDIERKYTVRTYLALANWPHSVEKQMEAELDMYPLYNRVWTPVRAVWIAACRKNKYRFC
jgi:hypothetical protein